MKSTKMALALALGLGAASVAVPASAQQAAAQPEMPQLKPSSEAVEAIAALQAAVNANDTANIPARLAAAQAAAKTADDRFIIAALQLKAATAANDQAGKAAAMEALLASGKAPQAQIVPLNIELAKSYQALNQPDRAATALQRVLAAQPTNVEAALVLSNLLKKQGRTAEAVTMLQKQIAAAGASGRADERLYRQAVQFAYEAKSPLAIEISRDWVAAYPTSQNWRDAMGIYRNLRKPPEPILVDLLRLARAVNALGGLADYETYALAALEGLAPAEAKAVVEEGIAAGKINSSDQHYRTILKQAETKSAGQQARVGELARDALAAPNARIAVNAGTILYSYGDYAKAAELFRAALGKPGADKDLVNLRLGMSLARAGDTAGATAALNAVSGPRAEVAKYWLTYLQTRS